jgi:hypothetical protein
MPSAAAFGKEFGLVRGNTIGTHLQIVVRKIGHTPIVKNRHYVYPIELTIARVANMDRKTSGDGKHAGEKVVVDLKAVDIKAVVTDWMNEKVSAGKKMVWTFYGNPYDIWIEPGFTVETSTKKIGAKTTGAKTIDSLRVLAKGQGVRNFSAPKKTPLLKRPRTE